MIVLYQHRKKERVSAYEALTSRKRRKTKWPDVSIAESSAQSYLDIMSYISTGRKHGVSAYEALTAAFAGNAEIVLQ